jgi:hypothetical protein
MEHIPVRPDWHRYLIVLAAARIFGEGVRAAVPASRGNRVRRVAHPVRVLDMFSVWFELRFAPSRSCSSVYWARS